MVKKNYETRLNVKLSIFTGSLFGLDAFASQTTFHTKIAPSSISLFLLVFKHVFLDVHGTVYYSITLPMVFGSDMRFTCMGLFCPWVLGDLIPGRAGQARPSNGSAHLILPLALGYGYVSLLLAGPQGMHTAFSPMFSGFQRSHDRSTSYDVCPAALRSYSNFRSVRTQPRSVGSDVNNLNNKKLFTVWFDKTDIDGL